MSGPISFDKRMQLNFETCNEGLLKGASIPVVGIIPAVGLLVAAVVELFFAARSALWSEEPGEYPEYFAIEAGWNIACALGTIATAGLGLAVIQGIHMITAKKGEPFWFFES